MNLAKTSLLNGLAVTLKVGTSLVLNKLLAVYVGPAGYAVIGQFQSFISMLGAFAGGAFNNGVTKYTAEYRDVPEKQHRVWQSATTMSLWGAGILALGVILAQEPLARWLLADPGKSDVMVWLAVSLPFLALNGLLLAIMNGRRATKAYVVANIAGSLLSAGVAASLVVTQGLHGALIAVAIGQAVTCAATAWLFRRACDIQWRSLTGPIEHQAGIALFRFALMATASAVAPPLSHMAIREGLAHMLGWEVSGLWQAMWRISGTHLMLLTTTLSVYFLPRYSEISDGNILRAEVMKGYRFVIPLVLVTAGALFAVRGPLIDLLLAPKFKPIGEALGVQLLGDVFKISSWVVAFTMLSHARVKVFIVSEIAFALLLAILTLAGAYQYGLPGSAAGYALTYALYWVFVQRQFGRLCASMNTQVPRLATSHP